MNKGFFVCIDCGKKMIRISSTQKRCECCQNEHRKERCRVQRRERYRQAKSNPVPSIKQEINIMPQHCTKNTTMQDYEVVSRKGVEFAFRLRLFKSENGMTWETIARIASVYAIRYDTRITLSDVSAFAAYKKIPSRPKMMALLDMMHLEEGDLNGGR